MDRLGHEEPSGGAPHDSAPRDGLWVALLLDGKGGARELDWDLVERTPAEELAGLWIHLDPRSARVATWLREESGLSGEHLEELFRDDPRPRFERLPGEAVAVTLRGLAPEVASDSRELAIMHMLARADRTISLCDHALPAVERLRRLLAQGVGPRDMASMMVTMAVWLGTSLQQSAIELEDPVAELEYDAEVQGEDTSRRLKRLQHRVTQLRRHLIPFKILVRRAIELQEHWPVRDHVREWQGLIDQAQDTDGLLQSIHERLMSVRDYVGERLARSMNYILYILTVFSTILLPLTFITGFLGMNVGIRGASYRFMEGPGSLVAIVVVLGVLAWLEYRFVRTRHLLPSRSARGPRPRDSLRPLSRSFR